MEQHAILSTVFVILVETIALFGYSDDYETSREQGNLRLSETDSNRCTLTFFVPHYNLQDMSD